MKVLVTGSGSHLAAALLPKLCARADVERVTGFDVAPSRFHHPKFAAVTIDVRDPGVDSLLTGHDALVHLARARSATGLSAGERFDINVNASHRTFHAARRAGVRRLVYVSSAAVYGRGVHLTESAPLAPLPHCLDAQHHAHVERLLEIELPECVRLRPQWLLGPNASRALRRLLRLPIYARTPGPAPLLQCVHEDDAAAAVLLALERPGAAGPYNLATEESFSMQEAVRQRHWFAIPLAAGLARAGARLARRWPGWSDEVAWLAADAETLLVNCRRAAVELGWRSTRSAAAVVADT